MGLVLEKRGWRSLFVHRGLKATKVNGFWKEGMPSLSLCNDHEGTFARSFGYLPSSFLLWSFKLDHFGGSKRPLKPTLVVLFLSSLLQRLRNDQHEEKSLVRTVNAFFLSRSQEPSPSFQRTNERGWLHSRVEWIEFAADGAYTVVPIKSRERENRKLSEWNTFRDKRVRNKK